MTTQISDVLFQCTTGIIWEEKAVRRKVPTMFFAPPCLLQGEPYVEIAAKEIFILNIEDEKPFHGIFSLFADSKIVFSSCLKENIHKDANRIFLEPLILLKSDNWHAELETIDDDGLFIICINGIVTREFSPAAKQGQ